MAVPNLTISAESVCFVIVKARQYDVQDVAPDEDAASNATDDGMTGVLEERADDPTRREIVSFIRALSQDEQVDLVALMRLGRGDATLEDWDDLRAEADQQHNNRVASYLLGEPLLGDFLEEGLSQLGISCEEFEIDRL
ncbi:MAG TPA: DUF3775 domain-containing protein [Reyranella sp.]|nr:DUF3775 domain-containing protein [Reyranella sp.]